MLGIYMLYFTCYFECLVRVYLPNPGTMGSSLQLALAEPPKTLEPIIKLDLTQNQYVLNANTGPVLVTIYLSFFCR